MGNLQKKVVLINPDSPFLIDPKAFPPLGLLYVAASLESVGTEVQVLDFNGINNWQKKIDENDWGVNWVGLSVVTPQFPLALKMREHLKQLATKIVIGGPHPTIDPESCVAFDKVVVGEGESAAIQLTQSWDTNRFLQLPLVSNLDTLPFPARHLIDLDSYHYLIDDKRATSIMSSRGCPYSCAFCCKTWGGKIRFRSPENVLEEASLLRSQGFEALMFYDDEMLMNLSRDLTIFEGLKKLGIVFRFLTRANFINEKVAKKLVEYGCKEVLMGIESGSDKILKTINKGTTRKINREAILTLKKHDIPAKVAFVVGLPGESRETIRETETFIEETEPADVDFTILTVYPKSAIYENPHQYDIKFDYNPLVEQWFKGHPDNYQAYVSTSHLSATELRDERNRLEKKFKRWRRKYAWRGREIT